MGFGTVTVKGIAGDDKALYVAQTTVGSSLSHQFTLENFIQQNESNQSVIETNKH